MYLRAALPLLAACAAAPHTARQAILGQPACVPAATLGILPGQDNTAAFRAILADSCIQLDAGVYELRTPTPIRATTVWAMPANVQLVGAGPGLTTLTFTGDMGAYDWRGIQLAPGAWIHQLSLDSTALTASSTVRNEQRHMMRMDGNGATAPVQLDHFTCKHFAGGDCVQFVGYAPVPKPDGTTSPDRRVWNVSIHDADLNSHRSGIAAHSGLNHFEFYNLTCRAWDQCFDFEGSGDIYDGDIHDNLILVSDGQQSAIGADINSLTRLHYHHNKSPELGMQIYYCWNCEFDHNVITQDVPNNAATVSVIAGDTIWFHDEVYTRNAGPTQVSAPVFALTQHGSVPIRNVRITDSVLMQHMSWTGVNVVGVQGFYADHLSYFTDGGSPPRIGINAESLKSGATLITQTTDVSVCHSTLTSTAAPFYAAVTVGAGVSGVTLTDDTITNASRSVVCGTGTSLTAYTNNTMTAPLCAVSQ